MSTLNTDYEDYRALPLEELREKSQEPVTDRQGIGGISNHYGGVYVAKLGNKYGWLVEDHNTYFDEAGEYESERKK
jgi:hypothetical protein